MHCLPFHQTFSAIGKEIDVRGRRIQIVAGIIAVSTTLTFSTVARAQAAPQQSASKSASSPAPAPKRDLTGVWQLQGDGSQQPIAPDEAIPPMTPWAKTKFDAEKPGYGARGAAGGNDPILQCDPIGFPRIMMMPTPLEFVPAAGRLLQFWEREHEWRPIWTDGRALPKDVDPAWYGYAIGHWEGDYTLVVESTGFRESSWLGPTGYPHSENMHITERYHRVDHDTIAYDITISDPMAYTKPIVTPHRTLKLKTGEEIGEYPCVWSEENSFTKRIREPATPKPAK
jgi:hypothetical protein